MRQIPLSEGQIVAGRYRVERVLGHGGMGVVVAARHIDLDEVFALKVMTPEGFESPDAVERFMREARTTAKLKSVHAVKVSDTGRLPDGAPFLAMEYLQGRDLERELHARGPLPPAEAAGYVMQACDVLAEAHALGIVHRDLKPANLFLTRLPNGGTCVKVLDFGIAKSGHGQSSRMTQTSSVFGTPLYMSPEQMKSSKSADPRSDIWSLGVVLYELMTGTVPYDAESMTALVALVMTELPVPPSQRRAGLGADVERVILTCLQRDPARRYPSAQALMQALAPIAQGYRPSQVSVSEPSWGAQRSVVVAPGPVAHPSAPTANVPHFQPGAQPSFDVRPANSGLGAGTQSALTTSNEGTRGRKSGPLVLIGAAILAIAATIGVFVALRGTGSTNASSVTAETTASSPATPASNGPSIVPVSAASATAPPPATATATSTSTAPATSATHSAPAITATASTATAAGNGSRPTGTSTIKPTPTTKPTATGTGRGGLL